MAKVKFEVVFIPEIQMDLFNFLQVIKSTRLHVLLYVILAFVL